MQLKLRDQIDALRQVSQQQYVSDLSGDCDIITCKMKDALACVQVFKVRNKMNLAINVFPENTCSL